MRIAWVTDIHLNFVDSGHFERFCREIILSGAEILLVGGDIGEAWRAISISWLSAQGLHGRPSGEQNDGVMRSHPRRRQRPDFAEPGRKNR